MPDKTEVYQDKAGEWRWRRKARNGEIIADSNEGYDSKWNAQRAASRVFGEPVEDDTPDTVTPEE
jgi:uncharacterized protein YegP (UPF0339 family)